MPKIKNICGVACKPKLAIISQVFVVCLAVLLVPADVWAGLTSLSLDAKGDSIFRGEKEHLNIVFSVDDETAVEGDSYTVRANQHLIRQGTIFRRQSARISWNGRINDIQLADGTYTISVTLHKEAAPGEVLERTAEAILDTKPPRISSVFANDDPNLLLTNGILINAPLRNITVIPDVDEGSAIDFAARRTNVVLKNARGVVRPGSLNYTTQLSFSLGNPLDIRSENGRYTLTVTLVDKAGNLVQETTEFTFDNVAPDLVSVAANTTTITPGSGVSQQLDFVEATLADNFENGVNLSGSTIRLTGPEGEILGRQTFPGKDKIRWVFLSPLLPKDGLHDGRYTVEVVGTDNAGNQSGAIRVPFVYDNLAPQLVSLSPTQDGGAFNQIGDTIYQNQPLTQIVAVFNDGDAGVGVDFEQGTRIRLSAIGAGNTAELLTGRTFVDRTNSQITYVLDEPLVSQDGSYRLDIQFADTLGNTDSETFLFLYDTQLPTLVSTFPAPNETVDNLSQIRIVLNETASGIDFIQSSFRLTREAGGAQIEIPVNITNNGRDTATLTVLEPIALDGSDDGTYLIEVTPTDRAGNIGAPARREFYLVSQTRTEVRLTMPEETTVTDLETVVAALTNYIGTGVNFNESTLTVTNPQGVVIPERRIEIDTTNNLLTWSTDTIIPRDGTADGEWTITATFVDFSGQRFTAEFPVFLDTQFPAIESVRVETGSQPLLSVNRTTDLTAGFSQIIVTFREPRTANNDVDFVNTGVTLVGPTGENIPVNRFDNGRTILTLNFQTLTQPGEYVLSITPQDTIGNRSTAAFVYRFQIDISLPAVSSVLIDGKIDGIVYVSDAATAIEAMFTDPSGVGLDLGDGGSTITVTGPTGIPAPGITTRSGTNQLRWVPVVLPTDGSADGSYTVAVTPVDRTGRQGQIVYRQLIYDTQAPRIAASTPVALLQPVTYIGGTLTQLQFTIEDVGPAGLELEKQTVSIRDVRGSPIAAARTVDEINGNLYLTFDAPFARDGSMDGEYRVGISLVDKAGNQLNVERRLIYDSQVPQLSSVTINTASPMVLLPQRLTEILEPISEITLQFEEATGVDFDNTVITLVDPDDASIPLTLQDDGRSQLTASFLDLHQVGVYTLSVTPRDIAGNVAPGPINYRIALGLTLPSVSSVVIGDHAGGVAYVNASDVIVSATFLDPDARGLALDSEGSSIVVTNASGMVVPGQTEINGPDQLIWKPISLPADGSVDGRYTVEVTPVDKLGRRGDVVSRQFIYDTETPRITSGSPLTLSEPVSYIPGDFGQFVFTVEDVGPSGLFFADQVITLTDVEGNAVPTTLTYDELTNELYLTPVASFPRDGSADGEYRVKVSLVDKAENRLDSGYVFVYDSKAPQLTSVVVNTDPPVALLPDRTTEFLASMSNITLVFEELTEVDFSNTVIELVGPDEAAILLTLEDDGVSKVVVDFLELTQIGSYTLSVTAQDIAGNVAPGAASYAFVLDIPPPSVDRVVIAEQEDGIAYVNGGKAVISVRFLDPTDTGLVLGNEGSNILVTSASGAVVPGRMLSNGIDELTWQPLSLPTDGSADGQYTVAVTPVDKAGRRGDVVYRQFIYDTEMPRITSGAPLTLSEPVSYIPGDFGQFVFTVEDVGPADLFFADQVITLTDVEGNAVPTTLTYDELTNELYLTPVASFPRDGSADGEYRVKVSLVDKAENRLDSGYVFVYDSKAPQLTSVVVNTDPPVALLPDRTTEFLASMSNITLAFEELTEVDFSNTVIELVGPDEAAILLTLEDDGVSKVVVDFLELTQIGSYTLSVTAQDIAGNVAPGAASYAFVLDIPPPSVDRVVIAEQEDGIAYVNGGKAVISVRFLDPTDTGLVLGNEGSNILVTSASGAVVPGRMLSNGIDELTWQPLSLPTDGSADGQYTVAVTPVDKAGRRGDVVYRQFIYDTEMPRITAASPLILSDPVSYIRGDFRQFVFTIEDVGPADLFFEDQAIALVDASGAEVPTTLTFDALASELYLTPVASFLRDGSADGEYTVKVSLVDKAENRLDSAYVFVYDSRAPRLTSVVVNTDPPVALLPDRTTEFLESISSITLVFEELTEVDFSNTVIELVGPDEAAILFTLEDDGISKVVVDFLELTQIGSYTLSVTPQDIAGNAASGPASYAFVLDIPLPSVERVIIGEQEEGVAYVNASNMFIVAALLDPTETGLAFGTQGSIIQVQTLDGAVVPGLTSSNSVDLIGWEPAAFTSDGSTDGRYSVYVVPIDKAGRQGNTVYREFVYDTQEPRITSADPVDLSQPVSYISDNLTQFHFSVEDVGPADLELSAQKVSLLDASGNPVPAQLTNDTSSEIYLTLDEPLSRDGSMDGNYTVRIELADKSGNAFGIEHRIVYDTQAPTLVSTVPANGALVTEDRTQVLVTLNDDGGSGMDWEATTLTLIDPNGTQISGELVSDAATQLTLNTNQLVEDGRYIIRVRAIDRAGNGSATVFERGFQISRRLPTLVSTSPTTAPSDEAFSNEEIDRIEVTIENDDENHLSTLRLLNASNQVVAGQQLREFDRLVYNLARPLAVDGSDDGVYTIEFTPISASGRTGDVQRLTFTHDTEVPEVEPEAISLIVTSPEVNNSLTEIHVNPTDEQSGIDWENVDDEWLTLERVSPNPAKISGRVLMANGEDSSVTDDLLTNNQQPTTNNQLLRFVLTVPLADNGSADGEYRITVTPQDRAGNGDVSYEKVFNYDTRPPMIDTSTLLLNDTPLLIDINAVAYPTAVSTTGGVVIQASMFDTGLGVNLAQSRIVIRGPGGTEVPGSTQQNGVDTLRFKSDGLSIQGLYQVTVISIGNDPELLGFAPADSLTTQFLYETTVPTAAVTSDGGETELTDEALPLEGTAADPAGTQQVGEGEMTIPASGVWLVEIVGTGPNKQPIDPVPAVDDSNAEQEPWSIWSVDFLPTRSGEYDLDVRVTDNAGNYEVYDIGEYTMSVSLTFREPTFGWPNPLKISRGDVAFFSFDVNVPLGETVELTLSIYDWSGDMILSQTYPDVVSGQRNDQLVKWNLENQAGNPVARGLYIFRLEAINAAGNSANAVGKVLVVE